jgi:hypothetical protein
MSLAQAILSGIRRKKEDVEIQAVSPEFRYYEILRALADDQEVDENELEGVLGVTRPVVRRWIKDGYVPPKQAARILEQVDKGRIKR